ncbi:MAG TPA: A/G-specific adenine glycosylase [Nevskiaceae bacterium]
MKRAVPEGFAERLLAWYDRAGRHDLPWQHPRTPYRVWVAEIMLQQTQVATVIPYFRRFVEHLPDVEALAEASLDEVLALWAGLGYYARARNLHAAAREVMHRRGGRLPESVGGWRALPGVGRSTAGAIVAQATGRRAAMLDANARRVLARHSGVAGWPGEPAIARRLWELAERRLPETHLADYTQALMDLGATVCTPRHPRCAECPLAADCVAFRLGRTAEIPARRARRPRRIRSFEVLLLRDARARWLLVRRPERGIWGGLWCPPLVEEEGGAAEALARRAACDALGVATSDWRPLAPVTHGLTHLELHLHPVIACARRTRAARGDELRWSGASELRACGLPAPMRRILEDAALRARPDPRTEQSAAGQNAQGPGSCSTQTRAAPSPRSP